MVNLHFFQPGSIWNQLWDMPLGIPIHPLSGRIYYKKGMFPKWGTSSDHPAGGRYRQKSMLSVYLPLLPVLRVSLHYLCSDLHFSLILKSSFFNVSMWNNDDKFLRSPPGLWCQPGTSVLPFLKDRATAEVSVCTLWWATGNPACITKSSLVGPLL